MTTRPNLFAYLRQIPYRLRVLGAAILVLLVVLVGPGLLSEALHLDSRSAELYFAQNQNSFVIGQPFQVELRVKTDKAAINSMGFVAKVNPAYLDIIGMTTEKSFCTLYTENSFNALTGELRLSCGTPQPGFQGDSLAVRIKLRAKSAGITPIEIVEDTAQLLANDGKGSNIIRKVPTFNVKIQEF